MLHVHMIDQVQYSEVRVVGRIWLPAVLCATTYTLRDYDLDIMRGGDGSGNGTESITRESVEDWLTMNAGDFQSIEDFAADISTAKGDTFIPWATEDGELAYYNCAGE